MTLTTKSASKPSILTSTQGEDTAYSERIRDFLHTLETSASDLDVEQPQSLMQEAVHALPPSPRDQMEQQMHLPVGVDAKSGQLVTLASLVERRLGRNDVRLMSTLADTKTRTSCALARIEANPKYRIGFVGQGVVDQERALSEVRQQTDLGRSLVEIEEAIVEAVVRHAFL